MHGWHSLRSEDNIWQQPHPTSANWDLFVVCAFELLLMVIGWQIRPEHIIMPATTCSDRVVCGTIQKIIVRMGPSDQIHLAKKDVRGPKEDLAGRQSLSYSQSSDWNQIIFGASTTQYWRQRHFRCPSSSIVIVYHNEWGDKFDHVPRRFHQTRTATATEILTECQPVISTYVQILW